MTMTRDGSPNGDTKWFLNDTAASFAKLVKLKALGPNPSEEKEPHFTQTMKNKNKHTRHHVYTIVRVHLN